MYIAYNRHAESRSLVPKEHDSADFRFEIVCRFIELSGPSPAGPTPIVPEELNRSPIANLTPASELRCGPLSTCLPNEVVFVGQRKSDPPLVKSTIGFAGSREVTGCNRPRNGLEFVLFFFGTVRACDVDILTKAVRLRCCSVDQVGQVDRQKWKIPAILLLCRFVPSVPRLAFFDYPLRYITHI